MADCLGPVRRPTVAGRACGTSDRERERIGREEREERENGMGFPNPTGPTPNINPTPKITPQNKYPNKNYLLLAKITIFTVITFFNYE